MGKSFVHLHVHTDQSILDGAATSERYAKAAAADGQPALADTNHGSLGGSRQHVLAAQKEGIKPILGLEAYVAIGDDRHEKNFLVVNSHDLVVEDSSEGDEKAGMKKLIYHHVTLLARNREGWKNLMRIHAKSWDTFWSKPRIDTALIEEHSEGLIILTGCLGGMVAGPLSRGETDQARTYLERFIEVVGRENVYVEVMDHGLPIERTVVIPRLVALAQEYDLPMVATNDCHYTHAEDADVHDAWLALQSGSGKKPVKLSDPDRFRFNGTGFHLRTAQEMHDVFSVANIDSLIDGVEELIAADEEKIAETVAGLEDADLRRELNDLSAEDAPGAAALDARLKEAEAHLTQLREADLGDLAELEESVTAKKEVLEELSTSGTASQEALDSAEATLSESEDALAERTRLDEQIAEATEERDRLDKKHNVGLVADIKSEQRFTDKQRPAMVALETVIAARLRISQHEELIDWWDAQAQLAEDGGDFWTAACKNTLVVAERVEGDAMPPAAPRLPKYPLPAGYETEEDFLRELVYRGAEDRWGEELSDEVRERLEYEFSVIMPMGFASYFLIVWDLVTWMNEKGIRYGWGRGSAAGSAVSYCLRIVGLDPLRYNLLFERFLEPGRPDFPDVDLDIEKGRRDEVIQYLSDRWGSSMVAKIGTYGRSLTKWAIKSAGRLLGEGPSGEEFGYSAGRISGAVPVKGGKPLPFDELDDPDNHEADAFRQMVSSQGQRGQEIVELARGLTGYATNAGIHACGILLGDEPLDSVVPLRRDRKTGYFVTEWEGSELDAYGCLKLDVLGIRNYDVVTAAVDNISMLDEMDEARGLAEEIAEKVDVDRIPDPDTVGDPRVDAAWDLIGAGRTEGVFQVESTGMQELCRNVRPRSLSHLSVVLALYRPGPMGAGMHTTYAERKALFEANPDMDTSPWYEEYSPIPAEQEAMSEVLSETFGTLVYQEQMMRLSTVVAGFDATWRSRLRKAIGKKKRELMDEVGKRFFPQGEIEVFGEDGELISQAFEPETIERLWHIFESNADYAFNASHSFAYAYLTFVTAYLKANWPSAYCAGLLSKTSDKDKRQAVLASLMKEGVGIGSPDVNLSLEHTAPISDTDIVFGLAEIKDVGTAAGSAIIAARGQKKFSSLEDFFTRTSEVGITSAGYVALSEAGALDSLLDGAGRRSVRRIARAAKVWPDVAVPDTEWDPVERAQHQSERLKVILTDDHPMKMLSTELSQWRDDRVDDWIDDYYELHDIDLDTPFDELKSHQHRAVSRMVVRSIDTALHSENNTPINCVGMVSHTVVRNYSKREGRLLVFSIQSTTGQIGCLLFDHDLNHVIDTLGRMPEVGDIVCVSGRVQVKENVVAMPSDESTGDEDEAEGMVEMIREIATDEVEIISMDDIGVSGTDEAKPTASIDSLLGFYIGEEDEEPPEGGGDPEPEPSPDDDDGGSGAEEPEPVEPEAAVPEPAPEPVADPEPAPAPADPEPVAEPSQKRSKPAGRILEHKWVDVPLDLIPSGHVTITGQDGMRTLSLTDGRIVEEHPHSTAHRSLRLLYRRPQLRAHWTRVYIGGEVSHMCWAAADPDRRSHQIILAPDGGPLEQPFEDTEEVGPINDLGDCDAHYQPLGVGDDAPGG